MTKERDCFSGGRETVFFKLYRGRFRYLSHVEGNLAERAFENTVDKDVNRFESVVDGRRTYLGHLIPVDAPPRPDASPVG